MAHRVEVPGLQVASVGDQPGGEWYQSPEGLGRLTGSVGRAWSMYDS